VTANKHPRLFFVHIPKCGGMTLHAIIEREYPPEAIYTVPSVSYNDQNLAAIEDEWTAADRARIRVVKGHMNYGWHRAFGDDAYEYITLMRHPVERVLSFYSFIGEWHPAYSDSIEELLTKTDETRNLATYMLSGGIGRGEEAFDRAWGNIIDGRVKAGSLESFDKFLVFLRQRYGWSSETY
jgi:hypothetical protein